MLSAIQRRAQRHPVPVRARGANAADGHDGVFDNRWRPDDDRPTTTPPAGGAATTTRRRHAADPTTTVVPPTGSPLVDGIVKNVNDLLGGLVGGRPPGG